MKNLFHTDAYHFDLPEDLIARYPLEERSASRLLVASRDGDALQHSSIRHLPEFLRENDLLVFNNTKVVPARIYGRKASGGKIECLLERILSSHTALVHLKSGKTAKVGATLFFSDVCVAEVRTRVGDLFILEFSPEKTALEWFQQYGEIPLPPYLNRVPEAFDRERYQTVYAKHEGAVAAPTAGLHFTPELKNVLQQKRVSFAYVTLHVGAGTFQPVRVPDIREHHLHTEWMEIDESVCEAVKACHARGGRVIAVGTTSVRCLETAAKSGELLPYRGDTNIFIYPGYQFQIVDGLLTNFHLPESTLLMLVAALLGYEKTMQAYSAAVQEKYRFFSYGDAMLIL